MKWPRFAPVQSCRWKSFVHFLQQLFKAIDVLCPEGAVVRDPVDERLHPARLHPVVDAAPVAPGVDQPGRFQVGEVLRHGGLRDVESRGELLDGRLAARERLEDRPAAGIRQRLEDPVFGRGLHDRNISSYLFVVNLLAFTAMPISDDRFREIFNTVEPYIERRYGVPAVISDVPNPFTGDLDGSEIHVDYELSIEDAVFLLVHLFGHTVQWNLSEYAREIGTQASRNPPDEMLARLAVYEREACRYSLQLFHEAGVDDCDQW